MIKKFMLKNTLENRKQVEAVQFDGENWNELEDFLGFSPVWIFKEGDWLFRHPEHHRKAIARSDERVKKLYSEVIE